MHGLNAQQRNHNRKVLWWDYWSSHDGRTAGDMPGRFSKLRAHRKDRRNTKRDIERRITQELKP